MVEDGIGDGAAAETIVLFLGFRLVRERGASVVVTQFHELGREPLRTGRRACTRAIRRL